MHHAPILSVVKHAQRSGSPAIEPAYRKTLGLEALGLVHSHHLHGIGITFQTLQVSLVARRQRVSLTYAPAFPPTRAGSHGPRRLFLQDLKEVQVIGQGGSLG